MERTAVAQDRTVGEPPGEAPVKVETPEKPVKRPGTKGSHPGISPPNSRISAGLSECGATLCDSVRLLAAWTCLTHPCQTGRALIRTFEDLLNHLDPLRTPALMS